jgi:hypothetical protein
LLDLTYKQGQTAVQLYAGACIANVSTGSPSDVMAILNSNGIPFLIGMLDHADLAVAQVAMDALANLAIEHSSIRDTILEADVIEKICSLTLEQGLQKKNFVRSACINLSSFLRIAPRPSQEVAGPAVPVLCVMLSLGRI